MSGLLDSVILASFIAGPLLALAGLAWLADRSADRRWHRTHEPVTLEHRFEDWREPVTDFFEGRRNRDERLAHALNQTCFANEKGQSVERLTLDPTQGDRLESNHR